MGALFVAEQQNRNNFVMAMICPGDESFEQKDVLILLGELDKIKTKPEETEIDLILNSPGGNIYATYKMIFMLRTKCNKLRTVVPFYAKSAATLATLGSDEIVMGQQSELGPLDAPIEHPLAEGIRLSALDGVRPLEFLSDFCNRLAIDVLGLRIRKKVGLSRKDSVDLALKFAAEYIRPVVAKLDPLLIHMCYRYLEIAQNYGRELLTTYMFKDKPNKEEMAEKTITKLVWGYPEHGYAICCREARRINLNVTEAEDFPDWQKYWKIWDSVEGKGEKVIRLLPKELLEEKEKI